MHSAVMQNKKYMAFARENTVEVLSLGSLDRAISSGDAKAATFKKRGQIDKYHAMLVEGMAERGYERDFAERCFKQIEGFGEYGFPESHSASFALLVYVSCWLKCYEPAAFTAADRKSVV